MRYAEYKASPKPWDAVRRDSDLASAIRKNFTHMRDHRDSSGVSDRMLSCLRQYNAEYSPQQLAAIRQFGGSDQFANITSVKCRTLAALLGEIYLGPEPPWRLEPTPEPTMPNDIQQALQQMLVSEVQHAQAYGQQITEDQIRERAKQFQQEGMRALRKQAEQSAMSAGTHINDLLVEGDFYDALKDFITHFTIYPIAVLKGPYYKSAKRLSYENGEPQVVTEPRQHFCSPSPFDIWFSPGVSRPDEGDVVERLRLARYDLEALREVPTYDADAIDAILAENPDGWTEAFMSSVDSSVEDEQEKESRQENSSGLYDVLEFHGWVPGNMLKNEPNFDNWDFEDDRTHHVTVRLLNRYVISAHPNPDPLQRTIYHTASFEPLPGSVYGKALPEALESPQAMANAAWRAAINNVSLSSGPQIGINAASMSETDDKRELYPWKVWTYTPDPAAPSGSPLMFFQPNDNSQAMLAVIDLAMKYADELSAIPRYAAGGGASGGAQRTASGLAMLQGNVQTVIKHMAHSIDRDVVNSVLQIIYAMTILTDTTGLLRGDETIRVLGVEHALKREADKVRALEFLQITANPLDMQLVGMPARAEVLIEVAEQLGFDHRSIAEQIRKNLENAMAQQQMQAQAGMPPDNPDGQRSQGNVQSPQPAAPGAGAGRVQEGTENSAAVMRPSMGKA